MVDKFLNLTGLSHLWGKIAAALSGKQDALVSGTNIKTVGGNSLLGSGDVDVNTKLAFGTTGKKATFTNGQPDQMIDIQNISADQSSIYVLSNGGTSTNYLPTRTYVDGKMGDLAGLTTDDKSSLTAAINEVYEKSGEPFRVKQWASNTLNVEIPTCTTDIGNTSIAKMTFTIDAVEGADYQIVGMIAYEVFDAASGGQRINCWPVCQFTGNGQKELGVRWMCGGTTNKTARRINAWVLLKHR